MSSSRIIIIILIVFAALFVIAVVLGVVNTGESHTGDQGFARRYSPDGWTRRLGDLLGTKGSKLKLDSETIAPGSSCGIEFPNTITVTSTCEIRILPAEKSFFGQQSFRTATFHVIQGSIRIHYENSTSKGGDLRVQDWPSDDDDPHRGSLVILEDGGTLTFHCSGPSPCTVELEQ